MRDPTVLWTIVALIAAAIVTFLAIVSSQRRARMRSAALRQRFGPEYDRAIEEFGSPVRAERQLAARARRVERIRLHELSEADRTRFATAWSNTQVQFVDDPAGAVMGAHELIKEVMRARGYPVEDFEQRVADLSVDHATVVQHYRAARALAESNRAGEANTEELRQAIVHYRALFADLLQEPGSAARALHEVHA
jgi:hypothetical protein